MKRCFEYPKKRRYATQKDAETAILLLDNRELKVYKCDTCEGWHLTSRQKNKIKNA